jgi:hypothetical protein
MYIRLEEGVQACDVVERRLIAIYLMDLVVSAGI